MVKPVIAYTLICDDCGKDFCEGSEYSCYGTIEDAELYAEDSEWHIEDNEHYCYDCWIKREHGDEDGIPDYVKNQEIEERHDYQRARGF